MKSADDISYYLFPGPRILILGAAGTGKSTLGKKLLDIKDNQDDKGCFAESSIAGPAHTTGTCAQKGFYLGQKGEFFQKLFKPPRPSPQGSAYMAYCVNTRLIPFRSLTSLQQVHWLPINKTLHSLFGVSC